MIVVLMALISLTTIYFTRLLAKKGMRIASIVVAILYTYLIIWTYAVFIIDIADLGFSENETRISLLHGSDIYHSFVNMTSRMSVLSLPILKAIVEVCVLAVTGGILVAFHGLFEITREFVKAIKTQKILHFARSLKAKASNTFFRTYKAQILRMYCRMNC